MVALDQARLSARVDRARHGLKSRCVYMMGQGGFNPRWPLDPCKYGVSDCTGFVSWVLCTQRAPKPGRNFWIESTAIYKDATVGHKVFIQIPEPVPGCIVVYGDSGGKQGHAGVVERVHGKKGSWWSFDTIECASGWLGGKLMKQAIRRRENAESVFKESRAVFCVLVEDLAA